MHSLQTKKVYISCTSSVVGQNIALDSFISVAMLARSMGSSSANLSRVGGIEMVVPMGMVVAV